MNIVKYIAIYALCYSLSLLLVFVAAKGSKHIWKNMQNKKDNLSRCMNCMYCECITEDDHLECSYFKSGTPRPPVFCSKYIPFRKMKPFCNTTNSEKEL